ncbi:MAG TPA: low specificity L-threonine aldolase [Candidatus Didemnitutus sp.]|nr:low specificity L-threonine aldolase [Candidatus Didemnitutus sp.]
MSVPAPTRHDFTFASDNAAGIAPEALAALNAANAGTVASYGDDPWTERAKASIAALFEHPCEVFFVFNGTAANSVALSHCCRRYQSIVCHASGHVETDECAAPEFFTGGCKVIAVDSPDAKLRPELVAPVFQRGHGIHYPKPGALSLTQATELGTVYRPAEIRALADLAHGRDMVVHLDGARFANAAATLAGEGFSPADWTWRAGVDVVSLGGTKSGMNTTEAVVFFDAKLATDFIYRIKQSGQLAAKQRFASAQWCGMLESGAWLRHAAHANALARQLAHALGQLPGLRLLAPVEANGIFVDLPIGVPEAMLQRGWHFYRFIGENGYRLMCSWATTEADVQRFLSDLRIVLKVTKC